jgi:hypothetical protein
MTFKQIPRATAGRLGFAEFAIPTALVSLVVSILLMLWPVRAMQMVAEETVTDRLVWIVAGVAVLVSGTTYGFILGKKVFSIEGLFALMLAAASGSLVILFLRCVPAHGTWLQSALYWNELKPEVFHLRALELIGYSYFGLVFGIFAPPLALEILSNVLLTRLSDDDITPQAKPQGA